MDVDQRRQQINGAKALAHLYVIAIGVREVRIKSGGGRDEAPASDPVDDLKGAHHAKT